MNSEVINLIVPEKVRNNDGFVIREELHKTEVLRKKRNQKSRVLCGCQGRDHSVKDDDCGQV